MTTETDAAGVKSPAALTGWMDSTRAVHRGPQPLPVGLDSFSAYRSGSRPASRPGEDREVMLAGGEKKKALGG